MARHYLAQMNIARMRAPLTDPSMILFVSQLEEINAAAEAAPGFVWRLKEHGTLEADAAVAAYHAESILVNMSVWDSVETLQRYVYHSAHAALLRNRRDWFEKMESRWSVLWWIPAGELPKVTEGKRRLDHLREHGECAHAFNFKKPFPPPAED